MEYVTVQIVEKRESAKFMRVGMLHSVPVDLPLEYLHVSDLKNAIKLNLKIMENVELFLTDCGILLENMYQFKKKNIVYVRRGVHPE